MDNCYARTGLSHRLRAIVLIAAISLIGTPVGALGAETITYTYDARGRLVKVERTGSVNNNVTTSYVLDKADNRASKTTTGSPNPPPP